MIREFRRVCFDVARSVGGRVLVIHEATSVTPNFHQGIIKYDYGRRVVAVIGGRYDAMLAVAEPRVCEHDASPLTFVEAPPLMAALAEQPGFRVYTATELAAPFHASEWPDVHPSDVKTWEPTTVGEVLFNDWD